MAPRFDDQTIWITGAGSGLGRVMALEFAARGAAVALSGRRVERLEAVKAEIEAAGGAALVVPCDVTVEDQIIAAVAAAEGWRGRLDGAVANAGVSVAGRVEDLSVAEWRRQMEINVIGLAMTVAHALPALRKQSGRLALIGSVAGFIAGPGSSAYCASKAAVRAIGDALTVELHGSGVSCTTIHPGFVESDIARVDNSGALHEDKADPRPAALMWTGEAAARVMVRAIHRRKRELVFTGHGKLAVFLARHAPGLLITLIRLASRGRTPA